MPMSLLSERPESEDLTASSSRPGPKLQSSVVLTKKSTGQSQSKGVGSRFSPGMRNRGRKTGGVLIKRRRGRYVRLNSLESR